MPRYRVTIIERAEITYFLEGNDWNDAINQGIQVYQSDMEPDDVHSSIRGVEAEEQEESIGGEKPLDIVN